MPPRTPFSRPEIFHTLVRDACARHGLEESDEVVRAVDWIMRMPMIESTFVIDILPFDRRLLVNTLREIPLEIHGISVQGGHSTAIGVVCIQLGLPQAEFSRERAIECLERGIVPQRRAGDFQPWLHRQTVAYELWNVPKPWPLPPRLVDEYRDVMPRLR